MSRRCRERRSDGHPGRRGVVTSRDQLTLLGELRRALDRRELELHYQPKLSFTTGALVGVEALVRWRHPERGLVPPMKFIPLVERTGLIRPFTHYILDSALEQCRRWLDTGRRVPVAVNLSARNLLDDRLPDEIAGMLLRWRVPTELLTVEVTESAIMTELERAQALLGRLHALGVGIAIDDFGAGHGGGRGEPGRLGPARAAGCDVVQGYHVSRPLPPGDLEVWLDQRSPLPSTHCPSGSGRS